MFVLKAETTAWWPVNVKVPDEKVAGRHVKFTFEAKFTLIDADQAQARNDARAELLTSGEPAEEIMRRLNAFDFETWTTMVTDWRGVKDEEGDDVPFSDAVLISAVKQPHIRAAFERAYAEIAGGEAARKN